MNYLARNLFPNKDALIHFLVKTPVRSQLQLNRHRADVCLLHLSDRNFFGKVARPEVLDTTFLHKASCFVLILNNKLSAAVRGQQ